MLIGYARVLTGDQGVGPQLDALAAAGCERCFSDTAAGSVQERPQLSRALEELRDGHDTLVVWRLDRLGRSLKHLIDVIGELERRRLGFRSLTEEVDTTTSSGRLVFHIFAALAECERQLTHERTHTGLAAARAQGRRGGRPTVITEDKLRVAREMLAGGRHTMQQIADTVGVGRATLYRHLEAGKRATAAGSPAPAQTAAAISPTHGDGGDGIVTATGTDRHPATGARSRAKARWPATRRPPEAPGAGSDRRLWLQEPCPSCGASAGARCRQPQLGRAGRKLAFLHAARGWRQRACPSCHAEPGEPCLTPSGRRAPKPHRARSHLAAGELSERTVWEELKRRSALTATVRFAGRPRAGAVFHELSLQRGPSKPPVVLEHGQLSEALKAPVVARFAAFAGQPPIRGTLTWDLARHELRIAGARGRDRFAETLR